MNIDPPTIFGDELIKRWNLDARHVLSILRQKEPKVHEASFNDEVEYCRLLNKTDFPTDLESQLSKFQFGISEIKSIEKKLGFRTRVVSSGEGEHKNNITGNKQGQNSPEKQTENKQANSPTDAGKKLETYVNQGVTDTHDDPARSTIPNEKPLKGYEQIAEHYGKSVHAVKKWGLTKAGVAWRESSGRRGKGSHHGLYVHAYPSAIDRFRKTHRKTKKPKK